jgi:hypothetical protein
MRAFIDTIFTPVLSWLQGIIDSIRDMSVPLARPIDVDKYFGYFGLFGSGWQDLIETVCTLAFIYGICYVVVSQIGLFTKFKDFIKWW